MSLAYVFTVTATTKIYTLSLHDALPIYVEDDGATGMAQVNVVIDRHAAHVHANLAGHQRLERILPAGQGVEDLQHPDRSEEHTSELQSHSDLVCRLLLEKKKKKNTKPEK